MKYVIILFFAGTLFACNGHDRNNRVSVTGIKTTQHQVANTTGKSTDGLVYFSTDNGNSWSNHSHGIADSVGVTDIAVSDENIAISTKQGGIYLFNFETDTWKPTPGVPPTKADINALQLFRQRLIAGTDGKGIFQSSDDGKSWSLMNDGLGNLTIRRFAEIDNKLYAGTNNGLYLWNDKTNSWSLEYGHDFLQVNGMTELDGAIYIGTNQGIYKSATDSKTWEEIRPDWSLHNIGVSDKVIYAMVYNELYTSSDHGLTWQNDQSGMPPGKYSFQVIQSGPNVLVGQWDGIYKSDKMLNWIKVDNGLPANFPVTEIKTRPDMVIAASSGWHKE